MGPAAPPNEIDARPPRRGPAARGLLRLPALAAALILPPLAACGGGRTVTLGDGSPRPYHFGAAALVAELASTAQTDNPTLTGDRLEIYFTSDRGGNGDIWSARRAAVAQPFDPPSLIAGVNSASFETSAAISTDGLTLWFGSDRSGGAGTIDVWVSTRSSRAAAWSTPVTVVALSSPAEDIPRPPGQHGLVMPLASTRALAGLYRTLLARRAAPGAPFGAPAELPELSFADRSTVDAFLSDDGLTMFYSSAPIAGSGDLFVAWRRAVDEPFSVTQPLDDLNTAAQERDPWLTPDGTLLYFTSDRDGTLNIYVAPVAAR